MSFNPPPGGGGITRTPFQMFAQQPPAPNTPYQDVGYIVSIDYVARTMQVVIRGSSGPAQNLQILSSVSIGTATTPLVVPGNWAIIQRIGNSYYITGYQVEPLSGNSTPSVPPMLAAPSNFTIVQIGDTLYASWSPVPGAAAYEIYQNTSPSPTGATIANGGAAQTSNTNYSWKVSVGSNSNILTVNPGFESGDFSGWTSSALNYWQLATDAPHSGYYYARSYVLDNPTQTGNYYISTVLYPVAASSPYVFSGYYRVFSTDSQSQTITNFNIVWYDVNKNLLSTSLVYVSSITTVGSSWIAIPASGVNSPANAAYASLQVDLATFPDLNAPVIAWGYDDFSLTGVQSSSASNYYAVRALGAFPGQASPFTSWLQPTIQSSSLGNPSSPHLQQDYVAAAIHSSTLSPSAGIAVSPNGFTDTGWNVPLVSPTNAIAETWTYASATTFTVTGDATSRYGRGTKIRLKQGAGYLYFYVLSSSYSAPNTTVTITGGKDYSLANAAITDNYYSYAETPQGFPDWFNYTLQWTSSSNPQPSFGNATITTSRFKLFGKNQVRLQFFFTSGSTTTYGSGYWIFSLPIAADYNGMSNAETIGRGFALHGSTWNTSYPFGASATTFVLKRFSDDGLISNSTAAWAAGDAFVCHLVYTT